VNGRTVRLHPSAHSPDCWTYHEDCAVSSAISYLTARIAHDQGRVKLYRSLAGEVDDEVRSEAVALARSLMHENSTRDWGRVG
jgi:hypothetical protein